ncbi:MAG TPA: glycoside hydrolase family 3 N-terminal domain-containing protein [Streptosporangiaceae bacterium]|nr:glycoside hydrolase family 3 N-terminal domain-containing protein [Streptosporangiaceae bacterium]
MSAPKERTADWTDERGTSGEGRRRARALRRRNASTAEKLADAVLIPPFPGPHAPRWVLDALERGLAGVTIFGPNIAGPEQLAALTAQLRRAGGRPLVAIDEEGGDVTRIDHLTGSPYPGNAALGAVGDVALTMAVHRALGQDLAELGITVDLAPSVDVNIASDNPVIGIRSFGSDPARVARHAAAAVSGLQAAGVAACAKHFPGHGSTSADTHHRVVTVGAGLDTLRRRDLVPFAAAIAAGVRGVMPGHLRVPELTSELPATLSAAAQTGLLRGELGFTGVIISDALEMRAVSGVYGLPGAAVRAVAAGTDLLCLGRDTGQDGYLAVRGALAEALASGRLPAARLEDAGRSVARLHGWLAGQAGVRAAGDGAAGDGAAARAERAGIGLAAARRAIRVSAPPHPLADPVVLQLGAPENIAVGSVPWGLAPWVPASRLQRAPASLADGETVAVIDAALAGSHGRPLVVVVRDAHRHPAARAVVTGLLAARPDAVVVDMGLPYWQPPGGLHLSTYGAARASAQAAAELLGLTR